MWCFCLCSIFFRSEGRTRRQVFFYHAFVIRLSLICDVCVCFSWNMPYQFHLLVVIFTGICLVLLHNSTYVCCWWYLVTFPERVFSDPCWQIPGCLIYFHYSNTCIQNYLLHSCLIYLSLVLVLNILLLHTSQLNEPSFSLPWCLHLWCTDNTS